MNRGGNGRKGENEKRGGGEFWGRKETEHASEGRGFVTLPQSSEHVSAQPCGGSTGSGQAEQSREHMFKEFEAWYSKRNKSNFNGIALNSIKHNLYDKMIIDSGATDHMFCNQKYLTNLDQ